VRFRAITLTPEEVDKAVPKWAKVFNDLFR
jgi:hypothetical protein